MNQIMPEIVCILDRSGSMWNFTNDTIGGYNDFIDAQRKKVGEARATLVLFDDKYEMVYEGLPLKSVPELTGAVYYTRGNTALLDAIGRTLSQIEGRHKSNKPDKTVVLIMTDGLENSSNEYSRKQIKAMVEERQNDGWDFFFIGAGIDAFQEAGAIGVSVHTIANIENTAEGYTKGYLGVSRAVTHSLTGSGAGGTLEDHIEDSGIKEAGDEEL